MASDKVIHLNSDNFKEEVENSSIPVLIDFWASWCGPCKMIAPVIDQLADEFDGKAKITKLNVDDNRELASQFKVMSIPTLLIFKNGAVVNQAVGARPKGEIEKMINSAL